MDLEQIKKTLDSSSGKALKTYLTSRLNELRDIESIQEYSTTATQTLELKAQLRAYKKLKEILKDIMVFEEEPREKKPEDSYAVE